MDDGGVLPQDFCLAQMRVMTTCGCSQVNPFGLPLWDLLRHRGHCGHLWARALATVLPKPPPGCRECVVSFATAVGAGLSLQGPPETLTPWDFASCRDVASQWKVSKTEEPSKPGLKTPGFRVVTFLRNLGDLHQGDPQRGAAWEAQVRLVSPRAGLSLQRKRGLSCCFQFLIHPKVIHWHQNSCRQVLGHSEPYAEQSIQKQRSYPNVF